MAEQTKEITKSILKDLQVHEKGIASVTSGEFAKRIISMTASAINKTPQLQACSPESIVACMKVAVQLELDVTPVLGKFYFVPRPGAGNVQECTYQIGYKGLIELVKRNKDVSFFDAQVIRKGDMFEVALGDRPFITHKPDLLSGEDGEVIGAYAVVRVKGEEYPYIEVISGARLTSTRDKASDSSPWKKFFAQMARKTAIRALANRLPLLGYVAEAMANEAEQEAFEPAAVEVVQTPASKTGNDALRNALS